MRTIHPFRIGLGILVTGIFIVPIHDPERAIGPGLSADRAKPAIVGDQKIFITGAYEARRGRSELIVIDGALKAPYFWPPLFTCALPKLLTNIRLFFVSKAIPWGSAISVSAPRRTRAAAGGREQ